MRINEHIKEEVRAANDLVEVIGDYVQLKRQGSRYLGLCPFHKEKTPSFHVVPNDGFFHCFGCKKSGDLFTFIEELEGVGFAEAVRLLAARVGIEIPEDDRPDAERDNREAVLHALRFAGRFFYNQLINTKAGADRVLPYLKKRGVSSEMVTAFGIGYSPDSWDGLAKAAEAAHIKPEVLVEAGLASERKSGSGVVDRFRDRLMFPILSPIGKVIGFGGRVLPDAKPDGDRVPPKYVNSPETSVYHKSEALFGLFNAKRSIRDVGEAIIVEGYTDVISLHQAGVTHAVACSGTAISEEQVRLLERYAKRLLLVYDADTAGAEATLRAVDLTLARGLVPYVVALPDGADPDSFVRSVGADAFRRVLRDDRLDFVTFHLQHARRQGALDTPEGTAAITRVVLNSIRQIADPLVREGYVRIAAEGLRYSEHDLRRQLGNQGGRSARPASRPQSEAPAPSERSPHEKAEVKANKVKPEEELLLRLMLEHGERMVEHVLGQMAREEFTEGPPREAIDQLIEQYHAGKIDKVAFVTGQLGSDLQALAGQVLAERHEVSSRWKENGIDIPTANDEPFTAANQAMRLLKLDRANEAIELAKTEVRVALQRGDDAESHQEHLQALLRVRRQLSDGTLPLTQLLS